MNRATENPDESYTSTEVPIQKSDQIQICLRVNEARTGVDPTL